MAEHRFPGNPATAVYGSIIVAGQLAIESATDHSVTTMLVTVTATMVVFWLAHAYTEVIGTVIAKQVRQSLGHALRVDLPILESALVPGLALAVGAAFGASPRRAATIAVVVAAVDLAGWAVLAARRAGLSGGQRIAYALAGTAFALVLVALKFSVH